MSTSNSSTIVHTGSSAVVRTYPWTNGVALVQNRREFMEQWLQGMRHAEVLVQMVLVSKDVLYHSALH